MKKFSIVFVCIQIFLFIWICQYVTVEAISTHRTSSHEDTTSEEILNSTEVNYAVNKSMVIWEKGVRESSDDDVLELNVGGERITTLRSTLTAVPKSKLAEMFMKNSQNKWHLRDKDGAFVFDYNPVQFKYLLDQLRMIKRSPEIFPEDINIQELNGNIKSNFSSMITDLGLNPDAFLSPLDGVHLNLNVSSLIGWEECYQETYYTPLDLLSLSNICRSRRLLVACRPVDNTTTLKLAGVARWNNLFSPCSSNNYCNNIQMKNRIGFYYSTNQTWGFQGQAEHPTHQNYYDQSLHSLNLNPCDSSDTYSQYRLCWSLRSSVSRGGGDRCGSDKNLHNSRDWLRVVYRAV